MPSQAPIPSIAAERCETCRFWKRQIIQTRVDGQPEGDPYPGQWGDCRRYAPRGGLVLQEAASGCISGEVWPFAQTGEDDWCGEYQEIPNGQ